jgi:hypothetical protein
MDTFLGGHSAAGAALDPLARRHMVVVALALQAAGREATEPEVLGHFDPCFLETLVHERLYGPTAELVLRYLHALTPAQCRCLVRARNRLELEADELEIIR